MSSISNKNKIKAYNYVKAIADCITDISLLKQLYQDFTFLQNIFTSNLSIRKLFLSPLVSMQDKKEILEEIFAYKLEDKNIIYFFEVLIGNHDFKIFNEIIDELFLKVLKSEGKVLIQVITANELQEDEQDTITKTVYLTNEQIGAKVHLIYKVDESIKGGYIIYIKNKVYNASIKKKITMARRIINEAIAV